MGWNKRSSGTRYDSISGHGIMFGAITKKVLCYRAVSKICSYCEKIKSKKGENTEIPTHECVNNHSGSSKSMESEAILHMCEECYNHKGFFVKTICADDDTTMKKVLRHNYDQLVKDGVMTKADKPKKSSGKLDFAVPEPSFLADFNHRVKSVGRAIYELAKMKLADSTVNKETAKRIKLYWSQMLNQLRDLSIEKDWKLIEKIVRAPVDHIFNNHEYCDIAWCYAKQAAHNNQQYLPAKNRPFYCKNKDKKMYEQLIKAVSRFQTKEVIEDCLHSFNTQNNEAFNQMVTRFVPKNKHFGTTPALDTRLSICVAITNMGYEIFFSKLLDEIFEAHETKQFVYEGIKKIHRKKLLDSNRQKTITNIRKRKYGKEAKAQREILEQRVDAAEKMGTYGPSVGISTNNNQTTIINKPGAGKNKYCPHCKAFTDHVSNRSKNCVAHNDWISQQAKKKEAKERNTKSKNTHQSKCNKVSEDETIRHGVEVVGVVDPVVAPIDSPDYWNIAAKQKYNEIAEVLLDLKSEKVKKRKTENHSITDSTNNDSTNPNVNVTLGSQVQNPVNYEKIPGLLQMDRMCTQVLLNIPTGIEENESTSHNEKRKYIVQFYT